MTLAAHSQYVCLSITEGCAQGSVVCLPTQLHLTVCVCLCLCVSEQHSCIQTGLGKTLCPKNCMSCHCLAIQGKISSSTLALRAALIAQQSAQQSAVSGLSAAAGCNRTAEMQYFFVVRPHAFALHCINIPIDRCLSIPSSVMLVLSCLHVHAGCITNI